MSMSLGGFITGPGRGLGVDGERLHAWLSAGGVDPVSHRPADGINAEVFDEMVATGAVITGRHTRSTAPASGRPTTTTACRCPPWPR